MDIYEVVVKLIGPITPVGDSGEDRVRLENLKTMTALVEDLLEDIDRVIPNKQRAEGSMRAAGMYASRFFDSLGITQ